jgi:ketosteroid isomerase-like protein
MMRRDLWCVKPDVKDSKELGGRVMQNLEPDVVDLLDRFAAAWNAHDIDALLQCMTEDPVFYAAAGPAPDGAVHRGRVAVASAYAAIWESIPDATWTNVSHVVQGDRAISEWLFAGTRSDGTAVRVRGVDVFTVRDGLIQVKDTFRKAVA